jgi:phenylpyruvate tautomerase PptA (4-oxalocrotonate tautomerase family)
MPISVQVTKGLLTPRGEREVLARVAAAFLKVHGLTGNAFMSAFVIGHFDVYDEEASFAGGRSQSLALVELKTPPIAFSTQAIKDAFIKEATDIIDELKAGPHPRDRTFVNVTYAVEGSWGIGGKAYPNDVLIAAMAGKPAKT